MGGAAVNLKTVKTAGKTLICGVIIVLFGFPILYMLLNSFVRDGAFSLVSYYEMLLSRPFFISKFWISLALGGGVAIGQTIVSCLAGFAFAKYRFGGRRVVFFAMLVLMLLPLQTMLVPNYIMFDRWKLLNTWCPLIVSGVFTPFGAFLMTQVFRMVPDEVIEAARLDGAGTLRVLTQLVTPVARVGVVSVVLLAFIDAWNMVEQPAAFLSDVGQYPLAAFLAYFNQQNLALSFACGVLSLLPGFLLFLYYRNELTQGIEYTGAREDNV
jgi:multiple sugar transport system permease protein